MDCATRHAATVDVAELGPAIETGLAMQRDVVCSIARAWDLARGGLRSVAAQGLWAALVAGRWSLVDVFTAGGARYAVARKNSDEAALRCALLPRERIVLEFALAGRSGKWTALEMATSESVVARAARCAAQDRRRQHCSADRGADRGVRAARRRAYRR
jgi:hypothetical protein